MDELRETTAPQGEEESREVVGWYVPRQGQEVVEYYVHRDPLPELVRPREETKKKRSRRGLWIFLGLMALIVVVVVLAFVLRDVGHAPAEDWDEDGEASSIVDIFTDDSTHIPRDTNYTDTRVKVLREQGEELTIQEIYLKCNPSTVLVVAEQFGGASVGTGVIMSEDGYIITNAHVIAGGDSCWIALDTGETFDALLVGYSAEEDIAVLKAKDAHDFIPAEFGDSELAMVGDDVYAIGNPLGIELRGTLTEGIISAINRNIQVEDRTFTVLQTTAALNNGNSGGPLINRYGQVIGINTLKMTDTGIPGEAAVEGLGFALPVSDMCFVVNDIIATGKFHGVPMLGITIITANTTDGGTAVMIYEVVEGYDAYEQGLQADDVILKVNGEDIYVTADLLAARRECRVGDTMTLTIFRNGEIFDVEVTLEANKDQ